MKKVFVISIAAALCLSLVALAGGEKKGSKEGTITKLDMAEKSLVVTGKDPSAVGVRIIEVPPAENTQRLRNRKSGGPGTAESEFTTIDFPGAVHTWCNSIRRIGSRTMTAGRYLSTDGNVYGWLNDGEGFLAVQVFGGRFTSISYFQATPLLFGGQVDDVGDGEGCLQPGSGPCASFKYQEESGWEGVPCPSLPEGCNNLVALTPGPSGAFTDDSGVVKGLGVTPFFEVIHPPGATYSYGRGLSTSRFIGRFVDEDGKTHGFMRQNSIYTTLDVPEAEATIAHGGQSVFNGEVVGEFTDGDGRTHGFLLSGGEFQTIDYPGAKDTVIISYNFGPAPQRRVCGFYTDEDGTTHGFAYELPPPKK